MQNLYVWAVSWRSILCCFFRGGVQHEDEEEVRTCLFVLRRGGEGPSAILNCHAQPSMHVSGWFSGWSRVTGGGRGRRALPVRRVTPFPEPLPHIWTQSWSHFWVLCSWEPKGSHRCRQPTCLSFGTRWRKLSVLGQSLSLLLQQLSDIRHLSWGHWFGSAVWSRPPNSVSWLGNNNNKKIKLLNICQIHTIYKKELKNNTVFTLL